MVEGFVFVFFLGFYGFRVLGLVKGIGGFRIFAIRVFGVWLNFFWVGFYGFRASRFGSGLWGFRFLWF